MHFAPGGIERSETGLKRYKNSNLLLYLSGFCLLITGLFLVIFPFKEYAANIRTMSLAMVGIGILFLLSFVFNKKWYFRPGWTLAQGFFLMILGILCLYTFDRELSDGLNLIFAMWALCSGTTQIASSIQLRALEFVKWWRILLGGFLNICFFLYFVMDPLSDYIAVYTSFGVYFLAAGIICLSEPFAYKVTLE